MTCNLNLQLPRLAWSCRQGPEVRSEAPKGVNPTLWFMYLKLSWPPKQPPMSFIGFPYTLGFFLRDRVPANFQTFDLIELRWLMRLKYLPQIDQVNLRLVKRISLRVGCFFQTYIHCLCNKTYKVILFFVTKGEISHSHPTPMFGPIPQKYGKGEWETGNQVPLLKVPGEIPHYL